MKAECNRNRIFANTKSSVTCNFHWNIIQIYVFLLVNLLLRHDFANCSDCVLSSRRSLFNQYGLVHAFVWNDPCITVSHTSITITKAPTLLVQVVVFGEKWYTYYKWIFRVSFSFWFFVFQSHVIVINPTAHCEAKIGFNTYLVFGFYIWFHRLKIARGERKARPKDIVKDTQNYIESFIAWITECILS